MTNIFGIGVFHIKHDTNLGTLWRSAYQLGASFVFTINRRYKVLASDTCKTTNQIPCYHYISLEDFMRHIPLGFRLVGIETGGRDIKSFAHFEKCIYLLGAEDHGLSKEAISKCEKLITLPSIRMPSYNVAVAGALVMYDRFYKMVTK